jgi:DNA-binding MurR/RpiR family transcriptional regulator
MTWTGADDAPPTARIAALSTSLGPSERIVAQVIAADIAEAVERTAQELADEAGAGRATVVRTAQALGYDGYPQLRIALALEVARHEREDAVVTDGTLLGSIVTAVERFRSRLAHTTSALTESAVVDFISRLDAADRVLIAASGLSVPLSLDLVMRLNAIGRSAEYLPNALSQQIAASQLSATSVCLAISGSGVSSATLDVMKTAKESGAQVLSLTSFAGSAVELASDVALVIPPVEGSFHGELVHSSRASLALIVEALVDAVVIYRGDDGEDAQAAVLSVISKTIAD